VILTGRVPFNADEAVVALMARHIKAGEFPIFFYGQAYMGSLDAAVISIGFRLFGEHIWVIRALQVVLYLGTVGCTAELGKKITHSRTVGLIAGLLAAVPPVNVVLYTTVTLGGYGEALLIGAVLFLLTLQLGKELGKPPYAGAFRVFWMASGWGILAGLGLWGFGLTLIYILPAGIVLIYQSWRKRKSRLVYILWGGILGGFLMGAVPLWMYLHREGAAILLREWAGSAVAGADRAPGILQPLVHLYHLLLLGSSVIFGLRPPWSTRWLMLPLIPFALAFWTAVILLGGRRVFRARSRSDGFLLLAGMSALLLLGFLFTPFGNDPSGRYFVPLMLPLCILAAKMIVEWTPGRELLRAGLVAGLLVFNAGGTVQSLLNYPPGLTTQFDRVAQVDHGEMDRLIRFLKQEDITRGYTNYWVAYPLAFRSGEEIIFVPRLPYHQDFRYTTRDDRYPPYRELVQQADQVAYITTHHPSLNDILRTHFIHRKIDWSEALIGDYRIFYDFSELIRPSDMNLGVNRGQ
jgi:4-amino-4-deoxy-L-arabinose transferase-like glycosyltransferase